MKENEVFTGKSYFYCGGLRGVKCQSYKKGKAWDHKGISKGNSRSLQRAGAYK